jgi:transposase InsO family protein
VAHRNARLTPFGRLVLVQRVIELGWTPAAAADAAQVSRASTYKWLRRYREEGVLGLEDRPSRPRRCPHRLSQHQVDRILKARRRDKAGPHVLAPRLGLPRSTIYGVLRRHGLSRLDYIDRPTGAPIRRYQKDRPGELVHIDVKKLAKIPPGGGWRIKGRGPRTYKQKIRHLGYDYIHSAVDDCTRIAFSQILPNERGETCARFLLDTAAFFAECGITIERVMTDEAKNYTRSRAFADACSVIGCGHITTGPYRPQINGKVERFNRTLIWEWAYKRLYRTNAERTKAFPRWLEHYNRRRPHTALGGLAPMAFLFNNVGGNYS